MDSKRLEELLQKYWNCESSLEEEEELRIYFQTHEVPEALKDTADLFRYFGDFKEKNIDHVPLDAAAINKAAKPKAAGKVRSLVYNTMRIAAGVAALVAAIWFVHHELYEPPAPTVAGTEKEPEDTFDDPKIAFEETKKALMMISKGFGKAEKQARNINLFNEAKEEIQEQDAQSSKKL